MSTPAEYYIGLMSGTSLDGIDAVLAQFSTQPWLVASHFDAFPDRFRTELRSLFQPGKDELHRSAMAANELSRRYAESVDRLLGAADVDRAQVRAIGCHGQTVRHNPHHRYSIQLLNGADLVERTRIAVVCDFRGRDIAAGGEGAPLVPAFHAAAFAHPDQPRAVVNIGGIANITYLPVMGNVLGFDSGPGNALLDEWISACQGLPYDAEGQWAAQGAVNDTLLNALLDHPYFAACPPKSTGREAFNIEWARAYMIGQPRPVDVQATFAELTARSLANAMHRFCADVAHVYLCGGGAANTDLVARIRRALGHAQVETTAALGTNPDWIEALAFAWLAHETLAGRPGNVPSVTGSRGPRLLGCIYPA